MRLKDMIKSFEFSEENRDRIDLTGGLRLTPGSVSTRPAILELPRQAAPNGHLYSLSTTLSAATWVAIPLSAKEWRGFEAKINHARDPDGGGAIVTSAGYRTTDGTDEYIWDGGAWVVNTVDWNTEAEIANNIATFPITSRQIGFIVNLVTDDARVTPRLVELKVLYGSDIEHMDDYLNRSLLPDMKAKVRPLGRLLYDHPGGLTFTLTDQTRPETPYNIVDIDSVFNEDTDPNHLTDLLSSYNTGTGLITLTSNPGAAELFIKFIYQPVVAVTTSRDYDEVRTVPSIVIEDPRLIEAYEWECPDSVLNKDTNAGVKVFGPRQGDLEFTVRFTVDKAYDRAVLGGALREYFAQNVFLRSVGMDQNFRLWLVDEDAFSVTPNRNDMSEGRLRARICGAVFFERGSQPVTGVSNFSINGPPNMSVP